MNKRNLEFNRKKLWRKNVNSHCGSLYIIYNKPKGCFVSGRFVSTDILSRRMFCLYGCFVPTDVLSLRTFCPYGRFVPTDVMFPGVLSPDILSPDVLSLRTFCLRTFCLGTADPSFRIQIFQQLCNKQNSFNTPRHWEKICSSLVKSSFNQREEICLLRFLSINLIVLKKGRRRKAQKLWLLSGIPMMPKTES